MHKVLASELPDQAFLATYRSMGAYTDCYAVTLDFDLSFPHYVESFYTTWLFKLERWVLSWLARRPSTDAQAGDLARGRTSGFAAWHVEQRDDRQMLLCDFQGDTRSWLMCLPIDQGQATRLYFGSAIMPAVDPGTGEKRLRPVFRLLLGFHRLYSRALLSSAAARVSSRFTDG